MGGGGGCICQKIWAGPGGPMMPSPAWGRGRRMHMPKNRGWHGGGGAVALPADEYVVGGAVALAARRVSRGANLVCARHA